MSKGHKFSILLLCLVPLGYILKGALPGGVDLTLFLYVALFIVALKRLVIDRGKLFTSKIDVLFYLWALILLLDIRSSTQMAGLFKSMKFMFLGLSLVYLSRIFITSREALEKFFKYSIIASVLTEYLVLVDFFRSGVPSSRYAAFGIVVPIPLAMLGSITTLIVILFFINKKMKLFPFIVSLFPSIAMMTIAASKGPVLALSVSLILLAPTFIRKIKLKHTVLTVISVFLLTRVPFISNSLDSLRYRFTHSVEDMSTNIRLNLYRGALDAFAQSPLVGAGTDGLLQYPHNFFLEILAENGLMLLLVVSILLFMLLWVYVGFIRSGSRDYIEGTILAIVIASFVSLMFSFSYVDHKYLFLSIGLLITYKKISGDNRTVLEAEHQEPLKYERSVSV